MIQEEADEDQPNPRDTWPHIGNQMHSGYVGHVVTEVIEEITKDFIANATMTKKLIRYFAGTYYTDSQRRHAEVAMYNLAVEREEIAERMRNALSIVPELLHPVTVDHT